MTWNFLELVERGATSGGLYPVPSRGGIGIETGPADANPLRKPVYGLKVLRRSRAGAWTPVLQVHRVNGKLLVSDRRVAVTFGGAAPRDRSAFHPVLRPGSRPGRAHEELVGHIRLDQLLQVGVRDHRPGRDADGLGALVLTATDGTDGPPGDQVVVEILLGRVTRPIEVAEEVLGRAVLQRIDDPATVLDATLQQALVSTARAGFEPVPGEVDVRDVRPFRPVVAEGGDARAADPVDSGPASSDEPAAAVEPVASTEPAAAVGPTASSDAPVVSAGLAAGGVPPGWHADPAGRFEHRWWDGTRWTEHVASGGVPGVDPPG